MATKQEFLDAGKAGRFKKEKFEPATGIGYFDGRYDVVTQTLHVTVMVRYVWTPGGAGDWTDPEKLDFRARAKKLIEENWSDVYRIKCTEAGWNDIGAAVQIHVVEVVSGEHYVFRVMKITPAESSGGGITGDRGSFMVLLSNFTIDETKQIENKKQIFAYTEKKVTEALGRSGCEYIAFDPNSSTLSASNKGRLDSFARDANKTLTDEIEGLQLYVFGASGSKDKTLQIGLGNARAKAVTDYLDNLIDHDSFVRSVSSTIKHSWLGEAVKGIAARSTPGKATTSFEGAVAMVHVPKSYAQYRFVESHYIVLLHEFGHCLGLPDEYMGIHDSGIANKATLNTLIPSTVSRALKANPSPRVGQQQKGMSEMMDGAGVGSPEFIDTPSTGYSTLSVMSAGRHIYPAHYLTIWACLAEMTAGYVHPSKWKIDG